MESEDLISAIQVMVDTKNCSVVFSAAKYPHPIERAFKKDKINNIRMLGKENANNRTQDFKPAFYDVGQFIYVNLKLLGLVEIYLEMTRNLY